MRLLSVLMLSMPLAAAAAAPTLCRPGETIYFNCTAGKAHKIASLCGHPAEPRYLQYRFGLPGRAPELQVPNRLDDPAMGSTFFYEITGRADGKLDQWGVWFKNADTIYELECVVNRDDGPPEYADILLFQGRSDKAPRGLDCASVADAANIKTAGELVEAMSPPGRSTQMSPYDERIEEEWRALQAAKATSR